MKILNRYGLPAALIAAGLGFGQSDAVADEPSIVVFTGVSVAEESVYGYAGGIFAPAGFGQDGVFLRVFANAGTYEFDTTLAPSGSADGTSVGGNISVGYRLKFDEVVFAPFVGVDFYDLDIDPAAADTGQNDDSIGVIVGARVDNSGVPGGPDGKFIWALDGNWASTNNRYYGKVEAGYDFGQFALGLEFAALGDDEFNAVRPGAFGKVRLGDSVALRLGGGYQFGNSSGTGNGSDTVFGDASIAFVF